MNKLKLILKSKYGNATLYICAFGFLNLSFLMASLAYQGRLYRRGYYLALVFAFLFLFVGNHFTLARKEYKNISQQIPITLTVGIVFGALFLSTRQYFADNPMGGFNWSFVAISLFCISISIYNSFAINLYKRIIEFCGTNLKKCYPLIPLIIISICIALCVFPDQPRWDSATILHETHEKVNPGNIFDIESTSIAGHTSQFYVAANCILGFIFDDEILALQISHVLLYILSIIAVFRIVLLCSNSERKINRILITLIWSFSPYVLGTLGYYSYDQWLVYLFVIIVSSYLNDEWIWFIVFSLIACFTKELFIVTFFGLCVALFTCEIIKQHSIKKVILKRRWLGCGIVGIFWLLTYLYLSNIKPSVVVFTLFNIKTTFENLKIFYILNFNWVISTIGIVFIAVCIKRKLYDVLEIIIPLIVCDLFTFIPYAIISTGTMARYMDAHVGCIYLIVIIGLAKGVLKSEKIQLYTVILLASIITISTFKVIDPVTLAVFQKDEYGNGQLVNTSEKLGDGIVYNSEYIHFDKALNKALEGCEESTIFFPEVHDGILYNFEGKYAGIYLGDFATEFFGGAKRLVLPTDNAKEMSFYSVYTYQEVIEKLEEGYNYFFSIPCVGQDIYEKLKENDLVVEEDVFTSGKFSITRTTIIR